MLTPNEIKKLIEIAKPDGFEHRLERGIYFFAHTYKVTSGTFKRVVYPLLLQRCIEGINRCNPEYLQIAQCGYSIQVLTDCNREVLLNINLTERNGVSINQAKEEALRYILEELEK